MARNVIKNSSFEADNQVGLYGANGPVGRFNSSETIYNGGTSLGAAPDYWGVYGSGSFRVLPTSLAKHGTLGLYMSNTAAMTTGQTGGIQQTNIKCTGRPYTFSLYVRSPTLTNCQLYIQVSWFNAAGAQQGAGTEGVQQWTAAQIAAAAAADGWSRMSFVPANTGGSEDHMTVQIAAIATGAMNANDFQIYMDAVQLETASAASYYFPATPRLQEGYDFDTTVNNVVSTAEDDVVPYRSGEITFAGVKFNDAAHPFTQGLGGWKLLVEASRGLYDLPAIKSAGDYEDPAFHGGRLGFDRFSMRVIELDIALMADTENQLHNRLREIRSLLIPNLSRTEQRLEFIRPFTSGNTGGGNERKFAMARLRKFSGFESTYESSTMFVMKGSLQFVCPDPAFYDSTQQVYTVAVPASNLSYATANYYSSRGNFRDYPVIVINGPVTNPRITISPVSPLDPAENGSKTIYLANAIPAGQYVIFDTWKRTVIHSSGADWRQYLDPSNQWWYSPSQYLPPGAQNTRGATITFSASVNASGYNAQIFHRDAWL